MSTKARIPVTQPLGQVRLSKRWIGSTPTSIVFIRTIVGPRSHQTMLGAHKGYDNRGVVADLRISGITPHVAQKIQARCSSPIDEFTARLQSYSKSINTKKRIEQMLGCIKQAAGLRQLKTRGRSKLVRNFETGR